MPQKKRTAYRLMADSGAPVDPCRDTDQGERAGRIEQSEIGCAPKNKNHTMAF